MRVHWRHWFSEMFNRRNSIRSTGVGQRGNLGNVPITGAPSHRNHVSARAGA